MASAVSLPESDLETETSLPSGDLEGPRRLSWTARAPCLLPPAHCPLGPTEWVVGKPFAAQNT